MGDWGPFYVVRSVWIAALCLTAALALRYEYPSAIAVAAWAVVGWVGWVAISVVERWRSR